MYEEMTKSHPTLEKILFYFGEIPEVIVKNNGKVIKNIVRYSYHIKYPTSIKIYSKVRSIYKAIYVNSTFDLDEVISFERLLLETGKIENKKKPNLHIGNYVAVEQITELAGLFNVTIDGTRHFLKECIILFGQPQIKVYGGSTAFKFRVSENKFKVTL